MRLWGATIIEMADEQPSSPAFPPPPSLAEKLSNELKNPQRALAEKLSKDWGWVADLYAGERNDVRNAVTSFRQNAQTTVSSLAETRARADATIASFTTPPQQLVELKPKLLEFRRDYKAFIVAGIGLASILPAALVRGSPAEKLRIALRNGVVGAGSAATLFYPELCLPMLKRAQESTWGWGSSLRRA